MSAPPPVTAAAFAALMAPLGPFAPGNPVAVAVSGGADSLALAWLAASWGRPLALVVDHGLRPEAASEAAATCARLAGFGVESRLLTLRLTRGATSAATARAARMEALADAARAAGLPQILLGHHAGDQAETVLLRALHGSGPDGRAGMAPLRVQSGLVWLRPLLGLPRARLRATLRAAGIDWVEDPSNADLRAERARLRAVLEEPSGQGPRTAALCVAADFWARERAGREAESAAWIARHVRLHPGGIAALPPGPWPPAALAALLRLATGAVHAPASAALAELAAMPRPATLGGARISAARGRLWLAREAAACAALVPASPGALWDGRFRLVAAPPAAAWLGALGGQAAALRAARPQLPGAVLAGLPALRDAGGELVAVPHLGVGPPIRLDPVAGPAIGVIEVLAASGDAPGLQNAYVGS